jgi:hypothetical protein
MTNNIELEEMQEEFLTWVMANRDVSARVWTGIVEPELKRQLSNYIDSERLKEAELIYENIGTGYFKDKEYIEERIESLKANKGSE